MSTPCTTNKNCSPDLCVKGFCTNKRVLGDPCDGRCDGNLSCHTVLKRCLPDDYQMVTPCTKDTECPVGKYCDDGKCTMLESPYSACKAKDGCVDGYSCYNGRCAIRCLDGNDCASGKCWEVPEVEGFKVCVAKDAKRPFPGKVDQPGSKPVDPAKAPPAGPGTVPSEDPVAVPPASEEMTNWTLILSAAGGIFLVIVIIAFIMIKRKKRDAFD